MGELIMGWRGVLAALAALFMGQAAAQSNSLTVSDRDVIPNFEPETIIAALVPTGASGTLLAAGGGRNAVGVQMPSGVRFVMFPSICDQAGRGCRGVSIQAGFDFPNQSPGSINAFNQLGGLPKMVHTPESARMYHYIIADVGTFRGNFNAHISVMEGTIRRYLGFVQQNSGAPKQSVAVAVSMNSLPTTELLIDNKQVHELTLDDLGPEAAAFINRAP